MDFWSLNPRKAITCCPCSRQATLQLVNNSSTILERSQLHHLAQIIRRHRPSLSLVLSPIKHSFKEQNPHRRSFKQFLHGRKLIHSRLPLATTHIQRYSLSVRRFWLTIKSAMGDHIYLKRIKGSNVKMKWVTVPMRVPVDGGAIISMSRRGVTEICMRGKYLRKTPLLLHRTPRQHRRRKVKPGRSRDRR
jgi:hypothetical protein